MDFEFKQRYNTEDLCRIMEILRSENGCPWDKVQTHASIRRDFIEECYEAVEAIDKDDPAMMREELGDVLLQVVFHCRIEEERKRFTFGDAVNELCQKLITRHPHVFGDVKAENTGEALDSWNSAKEKSKGQKTGLETLESVSSALPSLMRAQKLRSRAKRAGLAAETAENILEKITAETAALKEDPSSEEHIGRLLFLTAELAGISDKDAEECLTRESERFIGDFGRLEQLIAGEGKDMHTLTIEELCEYKRRAEIK